MSVNTVSSNGSDWKQTLQSEMSRLKMYLQDELDLAYMSYYPKVYQRQWLFQKSLYIDDVLELSANGTQLTMYVKFNDTLAYHNSLWNGSDSYLPILWSEGWAWKDQSHPRERFTFWNGNHFIENAVAKFNQDNPYGLIVKIQKY